MLFRNFLFCHCEQNNINLPLPNHTAHKVEAKRQIEIAIERGNTTQPEICAFITDEWEELDQNPLFYGDKDKAKALAGYILKVMRETGNEAGIAPPTGVAAWHIGTHAGTCEKCPEGSYTDSDGQSSCSLADAGKYVDAYAPSKRLLHQNGGSGR